MLGKVGLDRPLSPQIRTDVEEEGQIRTDVEEEMGKRRRLQHRREERSALEEDWCGDREAARFVMLVAGRSELRRSASTSRCRRGTRRRGRPATGRGPHDRWR